MNLPPMSKEEQPVGDVIAVDCRGTPRCRSLPGTRLVLLRSGMKRDPRSYISRSASFISPRTSNRENNLGSDVWDRHIA
jgi:hypothetical protein